MNKFLATITDWKFLQYFIPFLVMTGMLFYLSGCMAIAEQAGERLIDDVLMQEYNQIKRT